MESQEITETIEERSERYGDWRTQAEIAQRLKRVFADTPSWPYLPDYMLECFEMLANKLSRCLNGDYMYIDNIHDAIGYLTITEKQMQIDVEKDKAMKEKAFDSRKD